MARMDKAWAVATEGAALATELHKVLELSHRQAKGMIDAGCVKVNGEIARGYGLRLKAGDWLQVDFDPDTAYKELPRPTKTVDMPFKILWEDQDLLFVDKPAGLLTVPTEHSKDPSLADALVDHYQQRGVKNPRVYIVHRLDRYTSGVLVFAKTADAMHGLKKMFEEHDLNRIYKAILVGELPENSGTLIDKLLERSKTLEMRVVGARGKKQPMGTKRAITHYRVLERLPGHTVVEIKLETGRRNQIRVQFAERGFPLLGDQVYGQASPLIERQALHAELLGFRHPVLDTNVSVSAPLAADMETALKALRNRLRTERAAAGLKGEEGIFKPKITKERKQGRVLRAKRYTDEREGERPAQDSSKSFEQRKPRTATERRDGPDRRPRRDIGSKAERDARPKREWKPRSGEASEPRDRKPRPTGPREDRGRDEGRPASPRGGKPVDRKPRPAGPRKEWNRDEGRPTGPRGAKPTDRKPRSMGPKEERSYADRKPGGPRSEGPADRKPRSSGPRTERGERPDRAGTGRPSKPTSFGKGRPPKGKKTK